ncbi:Type II/IV secretion system protein [uncultured archaeon]|nr:Type II/IV secretion system protein [uncultured archaeon]
MSRLNYNVRVPTIQFSPDRTLIDIRYPLIAPYANAHIYWDQKQGEVVYDLEEPILDQSELELLDKLESSLREMINVSTVMSQDGQDSETYLDKLLRLVISESALEVSEESYDKIFYFLYRNFFGLNEIEGLMHDYFIEDIQCNGIGQPVFIVHRIFRNIKTKLQFNDMEKLASFVEKLAQKCGRYISYASPVLDGTLPDGSRVNATYSKDITSRGPTFTIRKFTKTPWTPIQLVGFGTLSPEMLAYLWMMMQYKLNVLIAGGTGSGKTTLLNAIAFFIPPEARVVSIEDTRELNLSRENWLPSVVRTGITAGGVGEVDMFSLLRASFRQLPDYVIVGEVRGQEASVLFQGMASGHASISTIHADSVETVIRRLETPPIELSPTLVNELDAVAIMAHAVVNGKETRKLREIVEVINVNPDGTFQTNTPFIWDPARDKFFYKRENHVFKKIEQKNGIAVQKLQEDFDLRVKLIYEIYKRGKEVDFDSLQRLINDYYRDPKEVLSRFGIA